MKNSLRVMGCVWHLRGFQIKWINYDFGGSGGGGGASGRIPKEPTSRRRRRRRRRKGRSDNGPERSAIGNCRHFNTLLSTHCIIYLYLGALYLCTQIQSRAPGQGFLFCFFVLPLGRGRGGTNPGTASRTSFSPAPHLRRSRRAPGTKATSARTDNTIKKRLG